MLFVQDTSQKLTFKAKVTGEDTDLHTKWNATYSVTCDANWHVRDAEIIEHTTPDTVRLQSDGAGNWQQDGEDVPHFKGCIDIDYRATPFSNTLPIRRLQLSVGESARIDVVYINAPDLSLSRETQIYTRINTHRWKFEQPSADFNTAITVDDEGFVVDYPGLFQRVA